MTEKFYIDVHAHLQDGKFNDEPDNIIESALKAGVKRIVNAGTCIKTSLQAINLAEKYDCCFALAGIHPHDASCFKKSDLMKIEQMTKHPKVLAIGEIGLDYHYDFSPRDTQRDVFCQLWKLAAQLNIPAVIHVREAYEDFFELVAEMPAPPAVMLHCFSGDMDVAQKALSLGYHFSVGGTLTFPKAETTRAVFQFLPDNCIHLETDCPYLAPQPKRGKRNEPSYLVHTVAELCRLRKKSSKQMAEILKNNAESFFGSAIL